jgi:hypothetical protein
MEEGRQGGHSSASEVLPSSASEIFPGGVRGWSRGCVDGACPQGGEGGGVEGGFVNKQRRV